MATIARRLPSGSVFRPPLFDSEEETQRARMFHYVVLTVMAAATLMLGGVALAQREVMTRALVAIVVVNSLGLLLLPLSRRGHTRLAGALYVLGLVAWVTILSVGAGGIRSPGVTMYFAFVLMAGVFLGARAAVATAVLCASLAIGLVVAELNGLIAPRPEHPYGAVTLLMLNLLYMALVIALTRLLTGSLTRALDRAETELTERRGAEVRLDTAVKALRERVKELTLLRHATRLLRESSFFDRTVLQAIVQMMPDAWQYPEHAVARLTYLGQTVHTPGWRETPWRMTHAFDTSSGPGSIEIAYIAEMPQSDEGPFTHDEKELLRSLAEMLVAHFESQHVEEHRRSLESQLRQSQKMQALGTLAGGIAHDFNNILTAIGGNVDLALQDTDDEELRATLGEVKEAHERARDLVRRILVFSRQQEPVRAVMRLQPVVEEALRLVRASTPPSIQIQTRFASDLPPVSADSTQVHQIVTNLGANAVQAIGEAAGTVTVSLDHLSTRSAIDDGLPAELKPGHYVRLTVADTGSGISPEIMDRLFEPFFTTKGAAGTGLGLSVVHGIVADHEGAIDVESKPGDGTIVHVYFPALGELTEVFEPAIEEATRGRGERIMYVDDEEAVVFVMRRTLERLGYEPEAFTDPTAALEAFRTKPHAYDAIVSDMGMPGMSGAELADAVHRVRADIPVIIASGYGLPSVVADGVAAWLQKPTTRQELGRVLSEVLDEHGRRATTSSGGQ